MLDVRKIRLTLELRQSGITNAEVISAIERPFSFMLITRAPKSCTAPMKMVPNTIHNIAGSHPQ